MEGKDDVRIFPFEQRFQPVFKSLNEAWIRHYGWPVEEADRQAWDNPQGNIVDKGGRIFIALYGDTPVGTLAMYPLGTGGDEYELIKFAVNPTVQGKGIGTTLMLAAISEARTLNARRLYLESNTRCESAIRIYRKLGFRELEMQHSEFARCDIQMELILEQP